MTKRKLKKWLEKQRDTLICDAKKRWSEKRDSYLSARDEAIELLTAAQGVHDKLEEAEELWAECKREISKRCPGISWSPEVWGTLHNALRGWDTVEKTLTNLRNEMKDETADYKGLKPGMDAEVNGIRENYNKVIANVNGIKNVKDAIEYLTNLGFDLSELLADDAVETALMVQVDTSYLFSRQKEESK